MGRKVFALVLAIMLAFQSTAYAAEFTDIKGHYAKEAILKWTETGVITGYKDNTFKPENPITRAEMANVIVKMLGLNDEEKNTYTDLPKGMWYTSPMLKTIKAGIFSGSGEKMRPNDKLTRAEAVRVLCLAAGITEEAAKAASMPNAYPKEDIPSWALPMVNLMSFMGCFKGIFKDGFKPNEPITRGEGVMILENSQKVYESLGGQLKLTAKKK